jgi:hypothetical protein
MMLIAVFCKWYLVARLAVGYNRVQLEKPGIIPITYFFRRVIADTQAAIAQAK